MYRCILIAYKRATRLLAQHTQEFDSKDYPNSIVIAWIHQARKQMSISVCSLKCKLSFPAQDKDFSMFAIPQPLAGSPPEIHTA